jgi:hypothetical protein
LLKQMPPGATPPLILNYSASTVPIIQLALSGKGLTEQNLADLGINFVRRRWSRCRARPSPGRSAASAAGPVRSRHRGAAVARPVGLRTSPTRSPRRT